jgi:hypothetical protein
MLVPVPGLHCKDWVCNGPGLGRLKGAEGGDMWRRVGLRHSSFWPLLHALTHSHTHSPHSTIHSFPTPHQPSTNTAHTHTSPHHTTPQPHSLTPASLTHSLLTAQSTVNPTPSLTHSTWLLALTPRTPPPLTRQ